MRTTLRNSCFIFILALFLFSVSAEVQRSQRNLESAESLFTAGKFAEAEKLYSKVLTEDRKNFQATVRLGRIALLGNRLDEAEKWLRKAIELKPEEAESKALLAEVYYRRDAFQRAAPWFRAIGKEAMAKKLESFKDTVPYQIEGQAQVSHLKFVHTDPLPVVQVKVNGSEEVNFIIDTGGGEVIIDTEFAKKVNTAQFGSETGTFAGGQQAAYEHGRIDSLTLGDFVVKNVPVHILSTRRFAAAARGKRVDGIIGTVLLYHFISTIDYPNGELILQRRTKKNLRQFEQVAKEEKPIVVPFWMSGDHFMVAWGTVNKSRPTLFYIDTGMAGGGFTCREPMLKEAGIELPEGSAKEGVGGGGAVKVIPLVVNELTLGAAREEKIVGLYGVLPGSNEYAQGFRIGGLISHQFFRPYTVTMDFIGMRFFLKRKA